MNKRNKSDYGSSPDKEDQVFRRRKIVTRTPTKQSNNIETRELNKMEELKQVFLDINTDIKNMKESIDKNNEAVKALGEEIKSIQEESKKEKDVWTRKLSNAEEKTGKGETAK